MKLRKYEIWMVNEETEGLLDLEYIIRHSDEVNSQTCAFEIWPTGEERIDFEDIKQKILSNGQNATQLKILHI